MRPALRHVCAICCLVQLACGEAAGGGQRTVELDCPPELAFVGCNDALFCIEWGYPETEIRAISGPGQAECTLREGRWFEGRCPREERVAGCRNVEASSCVTTWLRERGLQDSRSEQVCRNNLGGAWLPVDREP